MRHENSARAALRRRPGRDGWIAAPRMSGAAVAVLLALSACGSDPEIRYDVAQVPPGASVGVPVRTVEVREVSLPLYASLETISVEEVGGRLVTDDSLLWADDPRRQITQALSVALAGITRAQVAAEPWPFSDPADARIEVRFTRALAGADGVFRLAGQYFVASPFGDRRDVARGFEVAVPYVAGDVGSIARAKGRAIDDLAQLIARDGLRAATS